MITFEAISISIGLLFSSFKEIILTISMEIFLALLSFVLVVLSFIRLVTLGSNSKLFKDINRLGVFTSSIVIIIVIVIVVIIVVVVVLGIEAVIVLLSISAVHGLSVIALFNIILGLLEKDSLGIFLVFLAAFGKIGGEFGISVSLITNVVLSSVHVVKTLEDAGLVRMVFEDTEDLFTNFSRNLCTVS